MMGVFVSQKFGSQDAHLNPALTIAFALKSGDWSNVLPYITAQMIGAFLGAVCTWLFYYPHWAITEDKGAKLAIFATGQPYATHPQICLLSLLELLFCLLEFHLFMRQMDRAYRHIW